MRNSPPIQVVHTIAGDSAAQQLAQALVQLSFDAQLQGLSLAPFLAGLRRLAADWPAILQPHVSSLCYLTVAAGETVILH